MGYVRYCLMFGNTTDGIPPGSCTPSSEINWKRPLDSGISRSKRSSPLHFALMTLGNLPSNHQKRALESVHAVDICGSSMKSEKSLQIPATVCSFAPYLYNLTLERVFYLSKFQSFLNETSHDNLEIQELFKSKRGGGC